MSWSEARRPVPASPAPAPEPGPRPRGPALALPRRAALIGALALAGCGFAPVYGPGGGGGVALRGAVRAADPVDDEGFYLVQRIEARLGLPEAPRFALDYRVDTDEEALAIDAANNITRWNVEGAVAWRLGPLGAPPGATPLVAGREAGFTSYAATGSPVATLASARDARRRLMVILADRIVARLLADPPA
jgi:LPS-assembly lipoprotein